MQRSTAVILIVSALLAAAVVALPWGGGDPVTPRGAEHDGVTPGTASDGERQEPRPPVALGADAVHVTLAVTARERFVPPPGPQVAAMLADGTALATAVVAGTGAGFDAPPIARGTALVAIALGQAELLRQVAIGADEPAYVVGPRIVLGGRVVAADQRPIAGARVWFGERLEHGALREFVCDDEGRFDGDVPAGSGVPFMVRADGHAWQWRPIVVDRSGGDLQVTLQPECELRVQLAAMAAEMGAASAFVVPHGAVSSELSQWPFFLAALTGGAAVDARGEARFVGLPRAGTVGVVVVHPLAPLAAPKPTVLKGERVRTMVPLRFAAGRQLGAVIDDQRQPLVGASLWLHARGSSLADGGSSRLLPPHLGVREACAGRSGDDGRFELGVPDGDLVLSLRAAGFAGRDVDPALGAHAPLVLPRWRGGDASLRLLPPTDAAWHVATTLGGGVHQDLAAGEAFVVALPYAGVFDLELTVAVAGQVRAQHAEAAVAVTGPIERVAPQPE